MSFKLKSKLHSPHAISISILKTTFFLHIYTCNRLTSYRQPLFGARQGTLVFPKNMPRDKSIDKPLKPRERRRQHRRRNNDPSRVNVSCRNDDPVLGLCLIMLVLFLLAMVLFCFVCYFLGPYFHF